MNKFERHLTDPGIERKRLHQSKLGDPRKGEKVFGQTVKMGDMIYPDQEHFPGWTITLFSFAEGVNKDGCIFQLAPNTATRIGLVGEPPEQTDTMQPRFSEYGIQGSAQILLATRENHVLVRKVSEKDAYTITYGPGTLVAYIAGPDGFTGVNVGSPKGIPEDMLLLGDPRITKDMREAYLRANGRM